ncbi:MAG: hypothetical protein EXR43_00490 [Dehalococcoidia bacterium]|nr:hypothetical protein [Dehalococcoidia bacterium]
MTRALLKLLAAGLFIALTAAGSWLLSSYIQGFDVVSRRMVREAEARTGHAVFVPDVPDGYSRTGGIHVDPPDSPGQAARVVQIWESRSALGIYFVLTQGAEQSRPADGEPVMIHGFVGQRLVIEATKPNTVDTLMLFWRQGVLTYTINGVLSPTAEAAMMDLAAFLQAQARP